MDNIIIRTIASIVLGIAAMAVTLTAVNVANAQAPIFPTTVSEDSPAWNCYTDGNGSCNVDAYVLDEDGNKGAVMEAASDGIVYVAWPDGTVTEATEWQRKAAWDTCVDYATGTDASLIACDEGFQNPGDRFTR